MGWWNKKLYIKRRARLSDLSESEKKAYNIVMLIIDAILLLILISTKL